ncbi:hypothetical protein BDR05DRAFT_124772 [Suillus weaverae]|nr:hypothetical protein BDR05DRAFT_124772 [Suillus weaverae]
MHSSLISTSHLPATARRCPPACSYHWNAPFAFRLNSTYYSCCPSCPSLPARSPLFPPAHLLSISFWCFHRKFWLEREPSILETHKKARRTRDGLWSNYLATQRLALSEVSKKRSGRA